MQLCYQLWILALGVYFVEEVQFSMSKPIINDDMFHIR